MSSVTEYICPRCKNISAFNRGIGDEQFFGRRCLFCGNDLSDEEDIHYELRRIRRVEEANVRGLAKVGI